MDAVEVLAEDPTSPAARRIVREYLAEVVGRHHDRLLTGQEVDAAVHEFPNDELAEGGGLFLIAWLDGRAVGVSGCVGSREEPERPRVCSSRPLPVGEALAGV